MKKLSLICLSILFSCLTACNNSNSSDEELPAPKGTLQEVFAELKNNNFTLSYKDRYASSGVIRTQESKYTSYSLESSGDLGFNGYAKNNDYVFPYNIVDNQIVSGTPLINYTTGIVVEDIYDYRKGFEDFDYTFLPSDYVEGDIYTYEFNKNSLNDEIIVEVFLRMTYNPQVLPEEVKFQVIGNQLKIDAITLYYEIQNDYDSINVIVYDINNTENALIKQYLADGKTAKQPLDKDFYRLIAPYLQSNNFKTTLDATNFKDDFGKNMNFIEDQYFLDNAVVYHNRSVGEKEYIYGDLQTPSVVVNFTMDSLDADKLTISSTPYNSEGEDFCYTLYGEYIYYMPSFMEFSNFIGYIDEEHENSYYITDSQAQYILGYICKFELDSTVMTLKSLRLEVLDFTKHEFVLYFDVYNSVNNTDRGIFKVTFSDVDNVEIKAIDKYLNIGEDAKNQDISELKTVLNKFKNNNYSCDLLTGSGLAKAYYTNTYFYEEVYGNPSYNYGYVKEGDAIYEFYVNYNNTTITSVSVDRSIDYAASYNMSLPGCGSYYGANNDLFYMSQFDEAIYDYDAYKVDSILGYSYWKNTTVYNDSRLTFSNALLKYFYPNDTTGALPQGAGFIVSNSDNTSDTRLSLLLSYSSADGTSFGGQIITFYDINETSFPYLDNYFNVN